MPRCLHAGYFKAPDTVSAKMKYSRSPAAASAQLATGELHTNRKARCCWVASSLASNSADSAADPRNDTPSRSTTTTRATVSCMFTVLASSSAVGVSTSPTTVTTRASGLCSATRKPMSAAASLLAFMPARYRADHGQGPLDRGGVAGRCFSVDIRHSPTEVSSIHRPAHVVMSLNGQDFAVSSGSTTNGAGVAELRF